MHRDATTFNYSVNIERPAGDIDGIVQWCKLNFEDGWRWHINCFSTPSTPGSYTFFLNNNADYMAFVLKYG